ncbi:MAG: hypothetical protein MZW92_31280 [Comamonadaceae bacterium]|nr:hypothetical protein [Comamonadaceae bacterium]
MLDALTPKLEFKEEESLYCLTPPTGMGKPLVFKTLLLYVDTLKPSMQVTLRSNLRVLLDPEKTRRTPLFVIHRDAQVYHRPTTKKVGRILFEEYETPYQQKRYMITYLGEILGYCEAEQEV